jgi:uncharacterized protein with HEPN domain
MMVEAAVDADTILRFDYVRYSDDNTYGTMYRRSIKNCVYEFCENGNKIGKAFENANPRLEWPRIRRMRKDLAHNYPTVSAEELRAFAEGVMRPSIRRLRRAEYPEIDDSDHGGAEA